MSPHFLEGILAPRNVAVFGASDEAGTLGQVLFSNLLAGDFRGELHAINPRHEQVQDQPCYRDLEALGRPVDTALIATPPRSVPDILRQCGKHGVRGAVVLSAGFREAGEAGLKLERAMLEIAREYGLRVIGPNCLGVMRPEASFNATFSKNQALPGNLALVSQSGAICTAVLDWAESQQIGFSAVVSVGNAADVNFGDVLDYLALDRKTRSILLYIEGVRDARGFVSGLRAAARMKPVIVIKPGRHAESSKAAMSHTGSLVGADDVFDAALERAGVVRAMTIAQLFAAARVLSEGYAVKGNRLAIVTNAGGPGVMAVDRALELDVALANLAEDTIEELDEALPAHWSRGNPVDVLGDAGPDRFAAALEACLADDGVDGVITMLTPQAMTDPLGVARVTAKLADGARKPVLACWMGERQVQPAREFATRERLANFRTPEAAVEAFSYLAAYRRNQRLLLQVPDPLSDRSGTDIEAAREVIESVLDDGRKVLNTMESKAMLKAFRIPVTQTARAKTVLEALAMTEVFGYPVVMKIDSPDITHKSDVNGVRLNVESDEAVRQTFAQMVSDARELAPDARITGVTVERMHKSNYGRELMVGVMRDAVFGPVISFGSGGTSVEVLRDRAVALPPLNEIIIENMIARTRVARMLKRFRNMPAIDEQALEQVLLRVSEMVCELPEIREMDINPLIVDERGLVAVDARITVDRDADKLTAPVRDRYAHMAIHPYPAHLVGKHVLADGTELTVRPIRPEDAKIEQEFVRNLSEESKYFRFMQAVSELTPQMLVRFTQIDYDREMALIAVHEQPDGEELQVAVARYTMDPDRSSCEFALTVADQWQGRGVGYHLMEKLMEVARARGMDTIHGEVLAANAHMLGLMQRLGFEIRMSPDETDIKLVRRPLVSSEA
ncbi:MAG TPA: bifunctional acetate--CoA ligase family protein/GNAT family N-acetyltransferase [Wenzhouxiangellaceae bacterium]|nr:bifunctional acetate--CoA ligase family protein/GNAT family N-acetyltransferase [Wenzhouxiangellaceae bacterium]